MKQTWRTILSTSTKPGLRLIQFRSSGAAVVEGSEAGWGNHCRRLLLLLWNIKGTSEFPMVVGCVRYLEMLAGVTLLLPYKDRQKAEWEATSSLFLDGLTCLHHLLILLPMYLFIRRKKLLWLLLSWKIPLAGRISRFYTKYVGEIIGGPGERRRSGR